MSTKAGLDALNEQFPNVLSHIKEEVMKEVEINFSKFITKQTYWIMGICLATFLGSEYFFSQKMASIRKDTVSDMQASRKDMLAAPEKRDDNMQELRKDTASDMKELRKDMLTALKKRDDNMQALRKDMLTALEKRDDNIQELRRDIFSNSNKIIMLGGKN